MAAKITREQWILAKQMAAAVSCLNAPFCAGGKADGGPAENQAWTQQIAKLIAEQCGGKMALEDAIAVLSETLKHVK